MKLRCLAIVLALLAAFASDSWGQSPPKNPDSEPKSAQQATPSDQRGTEQFPVIVKVVPTPKTAEESAADRKETENKNASDWWLVKLTAALAFIGFLQLFVFGWQGIQLRRTVSLGREEFISTHRPIIRVRRVFYKSSILGVEHLSHGDSVKIDLMIFNVGSTAAHIIGSRYCIYFFKNDDPDKRTGDFRGETISHQKISLAGGESRSMTVQGTAVMEAPEMPDMRIMRQFSHDGWGMEIVGEIVYRDDVGTTRRTGFLRACLPSGEFTRVENPDYEYED